MDWIATGKTYACLQGSEADEDEGVQEEWEVEVSETQASSSQESAQERNPDTHVLKLLYQGNLAELDRRAEQQRDIVASGAFSP